MFIMRLDRNSKRFFSFSGSMVSAGSSSHQLGSSSQHRLTGSGLMRRSSKLLHNSTVKLTPIAEGNSTIQLSTKKKHEDFKVP